MSWPYALASWLAETTVCPVCGMGTMLAADGVRDRHRDYTLLCWPPALGRLPARKVFEMLST